MSEIEKKRAVREFCETFGMPCTMCPLYRNDQCGRNHDSVEENFEILFHERRIAQEDETYNT